MCFLEPDPEVCRGDRTWCLELAVKYLEGKKRREMKPVTKIFIVAESG